MAQVTGSGPGNGKNYAMVDNSAGTDLGRLWVSTSDGLAIARSEVLGATAVHKFGEAPDFDTADGLVTIWDGADDGDTNAMAYTYSTTANINAITSNASTNTQTILIKGLDANYVDISQTATLIGSGYVALATPLMRIYRMINNGTTDIAGDVYAYVSGPVTAGKPDTVADIRAIIENVNNQTLMALYTIPSGTTGYLTDFYASIIGTNKTANYNIDLFARPSGGVFQLKNRSVLDDAGTSHWDHHFFTPQKYEQYTDIEMRCFIPTTNITTGNVSAGFEIILEDN